MAMALLLGGCSSSSHNQIGPMELTEDQQEILDLITPGHLGQILLFDFEISDSFETLEVWLDVYNYGTLIEGGAGTTMLNGENLPSEGRLAVMLNRYRGEDYQGFQWTFTISFDGGSSSARFESPNIETGGLGNVFGPMIEPVDIQDGEEIILYISKFSGGAMRSFSDIQVYAREPELLEEYTYAHIIRARFSN